MGNKLGKLIYAAKIGDVEAVSKLLSGSVESEAGFLNGGDFDGQTALHWASKEGQIKVAEMLLDRGADKEIKDTNFGFTALHWASIYAHIGVIELLLKRGADKDAKNNDQFTALHWVSQEGKIKVVQLLLDRGADVDAKNSWGFTALHTASRRGNTEVVQLLLDSGANKDIPNDCGKTPLEDAKNDATREVFTAHAEAVAAAAQANSPHSLKLHASPQLELFAGEFIQTASDAILLSYCDADIYQRDLGLFEEGQWLNDACINYCFRRIEMGDPHPSILLMDPAVVSFLKIQVTDDEERAELAAGLGLQSREWILAPVNDCDSFSSACSHWSLLLCHVSTGRMVHYDSNGRYNQEAARKTALHVSKLMGTAAWEPVRAAVPQQTNGYDCGMYAVMFADRLRALITCEQDRLVEQLGKGGQGPIATQLCSITPEAVAGRRQYWKRDILDLAKDYRQRSGGSTLCSAPQTLAKAAADTTAV